MTVTIQGIGKITADMDTFNNIACLLLDCEAHCIETGYEKVGEIRSRQFQTIFDALNSKGYFKGV